MTDWTLYTITGAAALLVILLIIFVVRGKITIGEIEIGWPPHDQVDAEGRRQSTRRQQGRDHRKE
jgi:hypothetical protein